MNHREGLTVIWTWFFCVRHSDFHDYKANCLGVIKIGARLTGCWVVAAEIVIKQVIEICFIRTNTERLGDTE
jgi:hypothetical protein